VSKLSDFFTFITTRTADDARDCAYGALKDAAQDALATAGSVPGMVQLECRDFVREYGRPLLDRRTVVVILSDGWDTGDPDLLAGALQAIRQRGARILWLNPLLGQPDYAPETRGMAAALPLVHALLPAHNLASLARLEHALRS
jgi:uncharacterized protein with von Willebrand factor type A (vWA) domain